MTDEKRDEAETPEEPQPERPPPETPAEEPAAEAPAEAAAEAPAEPRPRRPRSRGRRPRRPRPRRPPSSARRRGRRASAEEDEEFVEETPRVKPEIPGMDLEVDIVREGEEALREDDEDIYGDGDAESAEEELTQPIADAAIDLAAGARYTATGKRKTAVARVILKPGTGAYEINGRTLDVFFPRPALQRTIRTALETVGLEEKIDVVAAMHGGGVSAQAGALRHAISQGAGRRRPEPPLRAQAPRLPHARRARQGAQEGRPEEGPQAAAVLEALAAWRASSSAPTVCGESPGSS